ncbi:Leucine-rich repeat-containing protein 57 [Quaeritorhiza haematococci]|nr:Leucine-rich repeat-containing protein 57 [Quaeritorhiza haematococci]
MDRRSAKTATRQTRSKATFHVTKLQIRRQEETPTIKQRIAEAQKTGFLDLRHQGLTQIPQQALKLSHLRILLLGNNQLRSLPPNFDRLFPTLTYLDLSNNRLSFVPPTLVNLDQLQILDLEGNHNNTNNESLTLPAAFRPLLGDRLAVFLEPVDTADVEVELENRLHLELLNRRGWMEDVGAHGREQETDPDAALNVRMASRPEFIIFLNRLEKMERPELERALRQQFSDVDFPKYLVRRYHDEAIAILTNAEAQRSRKRLQRQHTSTQLRSHNPEQVRDKHDRQTTEALDEDDNVEAFEKRIEKRNRTHVARRVKERTVKSRIQLGRRWKDEKRQTSFSFLD